MRSTIDVVSLSCWDFYFQAGLFFAYHKNNVIDQPRVIRNNHQLTLTLVCHRALRKYQWFGCIALNVINNAICYYPKQNGLDTKVEKSRMQLKYRKNRVEKIRGVKKVS